MFSENLFLMWLSDNDYRESTLVDVNMLLKVHEKTCYIMMSYAC